MNQNGMAASPAQQLLKVCEVMRLALEPGLARGANGKAQSHGACLYASLLLSSTINKFGIAHAEIRGGDGELDCGVLGTDGKWHGHYWVEATTIEAKRFVLDITADQFGHPPVVIYPFDIASPGYKPGDQEFVDSAAVELAESFGDRQLAKHSAERLA